MTTKIYSAIIAAFILLTTGCSIERTLKLDAQLPLPPAVKQNPIHIGVYYSPEFVEYKKRIEVILCGPYGRRDQSGVFFTFPIGTSSKDLFDQCISSMFSTVTKISDPPPFTKNTPTLDGVLEPRIESFDWDIVCSQNYFSTGKFSAIVRYLISLYDSDGHLVTSMHLEGRGLEKPLLCLGDNCKDSRAAEQAMRDAIAKFMIDFQEQPEVKRWLLTRISAPGKHE